MQNETISSSNRVKLFILHTDLILAAEQLDIHIVERFWSKVDKGHAHSCWLWTGCMDLRGGLIARGGGQSAGDIGARKLSWLIHIGAPPQGKKIMTSCKNSLCVNPAHFRVGGDMPVITQQMTDRIKALSDTKLPPDQDRTLPPGFSRNFRDRFWAKVRKTDSCWLWEASKNVDGYGWIGLGGAGNTSVIKSHRASWIMHYGQIPQGFDVLHNCHPNKDNPSCIRPDHLWIGDAEDNANDAAQKHRQRHGCHWNARLTGQQVEEIRRLCIDGKLTHAEIGKQFGVGKQHIHHINRGWRWSKSEPKR